MQQDYSAGLTVNEKNTALSLVCVFALISVFKVEEIVKRIFGFGRTPADTGSAIKSLGRLGLAAKIGKRTLDNTRKFVGGGMMMFKAGRDGKKANVKLDRKQARLDQRYGVGLDGSTGSSGALPTGGGDDQAQVLTYTRSGSTGSSAGTSNRSQASARTVKASKVSSGTTTVSDVKGEQMSKDRSQEIAYLEKKDAIDEQREEIDKQRKQNIRNGAKLMAKGVVEGAGAVVGGTVGGVFGAASGTIEDFSSGVMSGAGIGDYLGEKAVDLASIPIDFASDRMDKTISSSAKRTQAQIDEVNKKAEKDIERHMDKVARDYADAVQREINNLERSYTAPEVSVSVPSGSGKASQGKKVVTARRVSGSAGKNASNISQQAYRNITNQVDARNRTEPYRDTTIDGM